MFKLIRNLLMAAVVGFLIWWLGFGLTDKQIDAFQDARSRMRGEAKEVQDTAKDIKKAAETGLKKH